MQGLTWGAAATIIAAFRQEQSVRRWLSVAAVVLAGAAWAKEPTRLADTVAEIRGRRIAAADLYRPLVEAHGLNLMLNIVQHDLAEEEAKRLGVELPSDAPAQETQRALARMFEQAEPAQYEALLAQFLQQQRVSRFEFDLAMRTNALLRAVAGKLTEGRIDEAALQEAFRMMYGETVRVRHIACANLIETAEAKRRVDAGEPFEQVARDLSRNARTAADGGLLPTFSRATPNLAEGFKEAAFALQAGQVSDPVQADGLYHLIKLEERIEPRAVKFEDVRDSLATDLEQRLLDAASRELRTRLSAIAVAELKIEEPVLAAQMRSRLLQREQEIRDEQEFRRQLEAERQAAPPAQP